VVFVICGESVSFCFLALLSHILFCVVANGLCICVFDFVYLGLSSLIGLPVSVLFWPHFASWLFGSCFLLFHVWVITVSVRNSV